ncbi:MCE family protein [uncultured Williamsia sp.]|uniref:MCE family protein n=1 Tax=uncultured Williamsia sp. TaxID=259311 RepID=UPI002627E3CE|nr:MCE family protein [uncultured Williamsia sp.]
MNRYRAGDLVRVGILGLVIVVAVILAGLQFEKLWSFSSGVRYTAVFTEAGGLKSGDTVTIGGVEVGAVQGISLRGDGLVDVDFTVRDGMRLGDTTRASIETQSLLGQRAVVVAPDGTGQLSPSSPIPVARTNSPYSLSDALNGVTRNTAGLDTADLDKALDTLSGTLTATRPELGPTFDGLSRLSRTINARDDSLRDLLDSTSKVTGILATQSAKVNSLILGANDIVDELNARRQQIVDLLANTSAVTEQLTILSRENGDKLAPTLARLNDVTAVLQKNRDNIAKAIPGLAKYATVVGEGVSSGPYYNAYVANLLPGQFIQPFLNGAFGLPPQPLPLPIVNPDPPFIPTPAA